MENKAPEYTALEQQRMRDRFDRFSPELQRKTLLSMDEKNRRIICNMLGIEVPIEPPKRKIATLTYMQLAQNYNKKKGVNVKNSIRQVIRNMNRNEHQVNVVNKPGSIIDTPEGKFMISNKGKPVRIG